MSVYEMMNHLKVRYRAVAREREIAGVISIKNVLSYQLKPTRME